MRANFVSTKERRLKKKTVFCFTFCADPSQRRPQKSVAKCRCHFSGARFVAQDFGTCQSCVASRCHLLFLDAVCHASTFGYGNAMILGKMQNMHRSKQRTHYLLADRWVLCGIAFRTKVCWLLRVIFFPYHVACSL